MSATPGKLAVWSLVQDGFNAGRAAFADELCSPDFVNTASMIAVPRGPAGLARHIANARASIGEFGLTIRDLAEENGQVCVLWQTWGTSAGYFGEATARPTSAWLIGHCRCANGRIERWDASWEPLRLLYQGGAIDPDRAEELLPGLGALGLARLRAHDHPLDPPDPRMLEPRPVTPDERARTEHAVRRVLGFLHGDATDIAAVTAPGIAAAFADFPDQDGRDGLLRRREHTVRAFRTVSLTVDATIVEAGRAFVRWHASQQHVGPFLGLPPTGRDVVSSASAYVRVVDGVVVEWLEIADAMAVLRELGGLAGLLPGCLPTQFPRPR